MENKSFKKRDWQYLKDDIKRYPIARFILNR